MHWSAKQLACETPRASLTILHAETKSTQLMSIVFMMPFSCGSSEVAAIAPLVTLRTQNCLFIKMTVTKLFNKFHGAESFDKLTIHQLINKLFSFFCAKVCIYKWPTNCTFYYIF